MLRKASVALHSLASHRAVQVPGDLCLAVREVEVAPLVYLVQQLGSSRVITKADLAARRITIIVEVVIIVAVDNITMVRTEHRLQL